MNPKLYAVCLCLLVCIMAGNLYAQEPSPALGENGAAVSKADIANEEVPPVPETMWGKVVASGAIGYFLISIGLISLAVSIREYMALSRTREVPMSLFHAVEKELENDDIEGAIAVCNRHPCILGHVLAVGLARAAYGFSCMETTCVEELQQEAEHLQRRIAFLGLIAGTAPMLGLLGTVSGMIDAFGKIALIKSPNPQLLAGGIMLALMTTLLGLLVAIPSTVVHFHFKHRVAHILQATQEAVAEVLDYFRPVNPQR